MGPQLGVLAKYLSGTPSPWLCLSSLRSDRRAWDTPAQPQQGTPYPSAHLAPPPPRAQARGRPRLTLQHEDHHFLHRAHLILCDALVLARVVYLQGGVEGGAWCSGEQEEGDSRVQEQDTSKQRSLEHKPARGSWSPSEKPL